MMTAKGRLPFGMVANGNLPFAVIIYLSRHLLRHRRVSDHSHWTPIMFRAYPNMWQLLIRRVPLVIDHPASRPSGLLSFERVQLLLIQSLHLECRHYHYIDHLVYFSASAKDFFLSELYLERQQAVWPLLLQLELLHPWSSLPIKWSDLVLVVTTRSPMDKTMKHLPSQQKQAQCL